MTAAANLYPRRRARNVIWTVLAYGATALGLAMLTIIGGALVWSISIANDAPRLLSGTGSGLFGMPGPPAEIITGLLMLAGLILGVGGAGRVVRSIRAHPPDGAALPD